MYPSLLKQERFEQVPRASALAVGKEDYLSVEMSIADVR
jgi:hypothetical protein